MLPYIAAPWIRHGICKNMVSLLQKRQSTTRVQFFGAIQCAQGVHGCHRCAALSIRAVFFEGTVSGLIMWETLP